MKNKFKATLICSVAIAFVLVIMPMQAQAAGSIDYSAVFDAEYYYNAYADLRSAFGNDQKALLQHFVTFGMREGRHGSAEFDVTAYMQNNGDLVNAFGTENLTSYYLHYITDGKKEGRIAVSADAGSVAQISPMPDTSDIPDTSATPATSDTLATPATTLICSYTTAYDPTQSRAINIELSASKIDGVVVQPGQEFSFSDAFGPRTAANGYVKAPTFVGGKTVPGTGGGICQVSSTAYAAMLQGGIPATERHPHSKPVTYLPAGMDATIAAGSKDLKFVNIYDYPLIINATVTPDGLLTVSFSK